MIGGARIFWLAIDALALIMCLVFGFLYNDAGLCAGAVICIAAALFILGAPRRILQ